MVRRRVLVLLAVMALLVSGTGWMSPAGSAAPSTPPFTYLSGLVIHTARGGTVPVPLPERQAPYLILIGHSTIGWLVEEDVYQRIYAVKDDQVHVLRFANPPHLNHNVELVGGGTRLLVTEFDTPEDPTGPTTIVFSLSGHLQAVHRYVGSGAWWQIGLSDTFLYLRHEHTVLAQSLTTNHIVAIEHRHRGMLVDPVNNLLFVRTPEGTGPTSLTHPRSPRWRELFVPIAVSPNGRFVLGGPWHRAIGNTFTVRQVSDGSVVGTVTLQVAPDDIFPQFLGWVDGRHWLVDAVRGRTAPTFSIMSCTPSARCTPVSPWVTTPYSTAAEALANYPL